MNTELTDSEMDRVFASRRRNHLNGSVSLVVSFREARRKKARRAFFQRPDPTPRKVLVRSRTQTFPNRPVVALSAALTALVAPVVPSARHSASPPRLPPDFRPSQSPRARRFVATRATSTAVAQSISPSPDFVPHVLPHSTTAATPPEMPLLTMEQMKHDRNTTSSMPIAIPIASDANIRADLCCAVCFDVMLSPCKLPRCSHAFCKPCIIEMTKRARGSQFCCPLCRQPTPTSFTPTIHLPTRKLVEQYFPHIHTHQTTT